MTNNFDFTHLLLLLVLTGSSHVHAHSLTHTQTPAVLFKVARALLLWQPSVIRAAMRRCRCEKSPNIYSQADIVRLLFSALAVLRDSIVNTAPLWFLAFLRIHCSALQPDTLCSTLVSEQSVGWIPEDCL